MSYLGLDVTKPVFGVFHKVRLKPVSSATETSQKIEISLIASLDMILSKISKYVSKDGNNKGADQTARMRRLVYTFVDRKHPKTGFLVSC